MLKIYTLSNCDTCRAAMKWLRQRKTDVDERAIRETPPSREELKLALATQGGELRKLFNVSGRDYRDQKLGDKLPGMSEAGAITLLASNGNLVKRPFLVGPDWALVGFDEERWTEKIGRA